MTEFEKELVRFVSGYLDAGVSAEDYVKAFSQRLLNSIGQQSKPKVSEELEEYASQAGFDYVDGIVLQAEPNHRWNDHDVENAHRDGIIKGASWQKEQDIRDMYMSDNRHFQKVYELGRKDMKAEMMKEAVEGCVLTRDIYDKRALDIDFVYPDGLKPGDKVRIIIVKED